jgi:hypothetical protein
MNLKTDTTESGTVSTSPSSPVLTPRTVEIDLDVPLRKHLGRQGVNKGWDLFKSKRADQASPEQPRESAPPASTPRP